MWLFYHWKCELYIGVNFFSPLLIVNKVFTKFTDDIQILALHSKGVYNVLCVIWWHTCLTFLCNNAFLYNTIQYN